MQEFSIFKEFFSSAPGLVTAIIIATVSLKFLSKERETNESMRQQERSAAETSRQKDREITEKIWDKHTEALTQLSNEVHENGKQNAVERERCSGISRSLESAAQSLERAINKLNGGD